MSGTFVHLLRRELWEHPSLYLAPAVIGLLAALAALAVVVQGVGPNVGFDALVMAMEEATPAQRAAWWASALGSLVPVFVVVLAILTSFYLFDALYAERKDRSILFWKSLPVTDTSTVLSKLAIAILVAPLLTAAVIAGTHLLLLLISTVVVALGGGNPWTLVWGPAPILSLWLLLAWGFVSLAVWFAPFAGWFLLASAWARRAPFVWGVLPLIALGQVEALATGSGRFFGWIARRFTDYAGAAFDPRRLAAVTERPGAATEADAAGLDVLAIADPVGFVTTGAVWSGLGLAGVFAVLAILLRRYRDES